jgi:N-acetylgalactosamine-6-sulfatase
MTGQYPARNRVHGHFATPELNIKRAMPNFLDPAVPTVTKLLHDAGYVTGHFGKWHLGHNEGSPLPPAYGIDDYRCVGAIDKAAWDMHEPQFRARLTGHIVDESIRFIETNRDKPFFMQAWLLDVHAVLDPTEEQMKPYAAMGPRGAKSHKGALQVYYGAATAADKELGRLLAKLDELGLKENTIVVFSSDNGPEDIHLGEASHSGVGSTGPFRGRKRSLYEGGIRLPFIVRWPASTPAGKVDNTSVIGGVDFLPTICSLAGVPLKPDMKLDGQDMSEAFRGKPTRRFSPLLWEWRFSIFGDTTNRSPILAIRDGNWKLLMNPDRSRVELYDIPKDPTEVDNLAQANPQVVERLSEIALDWQKTLPPGPFDNDAGSNAYPWPR